MEPEKPREEEERKATSESGPEAAGTPPAGAPEPPEQQWGSIEPVGDGGVKDRVVEVLKTIFDPEIPINIYELGLVYGIDVAGDGATRVVMTLTSPNCPAAGTLPGEVETKVGKVEGVTSCKLELVWEPPWGMERMGEAARLALGLM